MSDDQTILIVAGEVSGDMHAASLVHALRRRRPELRFFGIGGELMRQAGVETVHDVNEMAVTGFIEVLRRFPFFARVFREMQALAAARRPGAVILVDYPGFNLRFAAKMHAAGVRTIYYICPQVWAWNRGRIPHMARIIDRLITIFPFEGACFKGTGLRVNYAGNPLVDETRHNWEQPPATLPWQGDPRIALLPGSRAHEIDLILPPMWEAAALIERQFSGASFILPAPSEAVERVLKARLRTLRGGPSRWSTVVGQARDAMRQARGALVASGTATVEASLMLCPHVIAYRASPLTYLVGWMVLKTPWIGMVNVIAGREVSPERLQGRCTPQELSGALLPLLDDGPRRAAAIEDLKGVNAALGAGGAEERAADFVLDELRSLETPGGADPSGR